MYDIKQTLAVTTSGGSIIVEISEDGLPDRDYVFNYHKFSLPAGVTPPDPVALFKKLAAVVREAMLFLGVPDANADPLVSEFKGLNFVQRFNYQSLLINAMMELNGVDASVANALGGGGIQHQKVFVAWSKAMAKVGAGAATPG